MTKLQRWYADYNRAYWNGALPTCTVRWNDLHRTGAIGVQRTLAWKEFNAATGKYEFTENEYIIELCCHIRKWTRIPKFTLLHEMAHLATQLNHPRATAHGRHWQAEMKRLASIGAFNELW